ncbi:hypothetical protein [Cerasicoccus maritimus]|uniref:hypothetical protein n=1 Tax=Cerasicoccus maritimus TaxID=490089 RepID=UPI0028528576|nr:hypothetical protein [Cerasicoccus maritimus]
MRRAFLLLLINSSLCAQTEHTFNDLPFPEPSNDDLNASILDDSVSIGETSTLPSLNAKQVAKSHWDYTIGTSYESQYMLRGRQAGYDVMQTIGVIAHQGASFSVWWNQPLDPSDNAVDVPEIDFTLNYSKPITEDVDVSIGGVLQYYPRANAIPGAIWGIAGAVEVDSLPASPTLLYQYIFEMERSEFYFLLDQQFSLEPIFGDPNVFFELTANLGYAHQGDTAYGSKNDWAWAMGSAAVGYRFLDQQLEVKAGPNFATNNDGAANNIAGRENNVWLSISADYSF